MEDNEANKLLDLLNGYFMDYDEDPEQMSCQDLMDDLRLSLP